MTQGFPIGLQAREKLFAALKLAALTCNFNGKVCVKPGVMTDENSLIDRIIAGEQQVYAELVNRYKSYAFTIALKVLQNRPEAQEAAQDAFIKAFNNLPKFNREAKFSTWLYRIAFNTAISYKRKSKVIFQSVDSVHIARPNEGEGNTEHDDKKRFIELAMRRLNDADRLAVNLFYLQEFSLEEIAEITGMQANTVKVRIHRARQRLAEELKSILQKEALTL
ncbi:MAG TPA: sigma-70 family RNA polymerase sigma factor [Cyclobacteriaceae bacterium]|nr:sigma-70 family RNA polymerase sigma factor [Cyclobacteriaceae bacterium]